jgi:cytochrome c6
MTISRRRLPLLLLGAAAAASLLLITPFASSRPAAKVIRVTATDTGFRLSAKTARLGAVTFSVVNAGKKPHSFKIAGKKTAVLRPGKAAKLPVSFARTGNYLYLSTVAGDARKGLKGVFSVTPSKVVAVTARDAAFRLSTRTAPVGAVGFVVRNAGKAKHTFRIAGKKTPVLAPGKTATLIVTFKKSGKYAYLSTVPGDAKKGLKGVFVVKGAPVPPAGGNLVAGKQAFATGGCGVCHVFKAAGASGTIGPNLDTSKISRATVVARITNGKGTMPAFQGTLTPAQIQDLADFVFKSRGG